MQSQIIQNLRGKLQKRIQRLNTEKIPQFLICLRRFWLFFDGEPVYVGIMNVLLTQYPEIDSITERIFHGEGLLGSSEEEAAAIGYVLLRKLSNQTYITKIDQFVPLYAQNVDSNNIVAIIRSIFLEPFYDYVDEQIDDQKIVLNLLIRYKHRSEWFHADHLRTLMKKKSRKAENQLALNLYSYLHDQGLDFSIEPSSISGEIDIIAAQNTEDPFLADVKIFDNRGRGKMYIRKAFNQIYTYAQQYNEHFGYLVIFKDTDKDLYFSLSNKFSRIPVVTYNYKTIFLLTIDIHEYQDPVSKRDPLNVITITEEELIRPVEEDTLEVDSGNA